jgi:tagatose-6-phosphate ketose/aldose isomerase
MNSRADSRLATPTIRGSITLREIRQQPDVWGATLEQIASLPSSAKLNGRPTIVCGAGSSAYAAAIVARAWSNARAIPTTDLLVQSKEELAAIFPAFAQGGVLVSLARSGESPESVGVIARFQKLFPQVKHLAITCNETGQLAHMAGIESIVLDPRTNDQSLVMTASFSNLALAGLAFQHSESLRPRLPQISANTRSVIPQLETVAQQLAARKPPRVAVLTSPGLTPLAQEASLKILEMTAGRVVALPETYLGLRHGPMSFLTAEALVLCVLSSDQQRRPYELDLIRELRKKALGCLVQVGLADSENELGHYAVPAMAPDIIDEFRTPFEIVFPQFLGYYLSLGLGLDPDNPSPNGVITRVVRKFQLHDYDIGRGDKITG